MTANAVRSVLDRKPFVPFTMLMNDGRVIAISHPELLEIDDGESTVSAVEGGGDPEEFRLDQVASLSTTGA